MSVLDHLIRRVEDVSIFDSGGYLELKTEQERRAILAALRIARDLKEIVDGYSDEA